MKKIEDYLHLYLGCKVRYVPLQGEYFDEILTGTNEWRVFLKGDDSYACNADDCKLLLRPLSSQSKEEMLEELEIAKTLGDERTGAEYAALITLHRLKKGFDLFQLIESGLALDASKEIVYLERRKRITE